jgi:hypothetical protein
MQSGDYFDLAIRITFGRWTGRLVMRSILLWIMRIYV